jgi:hypothetical protein
MRNTAYLPLSLEAALLGDAQNWRDDRKTWRRKKRRSDGTVRVSRPRSPAEDRSFRNRRAELLARLGSHDRAAKHQAKVLDGCCPRHPCGNAACPACVGAFQHAFVRIATRFMKRVDPGDGTIFAVSIIPADEMIKRSGLPGLDLTNFCRRMRERLKPIVPHCAWIILGVDLSLNSDKEKRWKPTWCPHLYGFAQTNLSRRELKAELKKLFPAYPPIVHRPVKVKRFKPSRYGTSYLLKPDFKRRITYLHSKGDRSKDAPLRSRRRAELQQVLRWLDGTRISDRLLLIGLKTVRSNTGVKIVPIAISTVDRPDAKLCSTRPSRGSPKVRNAGNRIASEYRQDGNPREISKRSRSVSTSSRRSAR